MRLSVFFDVETTGLPVFSEPSSSAIQPHIVQLAALLVDLDSRTTISSMDVIIRPDGWTIPDDVAAIHGITTEHATEVGVAAKDAISMFLQLAAGRSIIGHNVQFDSRLMRIALFRHYTEDAAETFKASHETVCTMKMAQKIMGVSKWPKLSEAYLFFTANELVGAHSAMVDVHACRDIYFAMMDRESERKA